MAIMECSGGSSEYDREKAVLSRILDPENVGNALTLEERAILDKHADKKKLFDQTYYKFERPLAVDEVNDLIEYIAEQGYVMYVTIENKSTQWYNRTDSNGVPLEAHDRVTGIDGQIQSEDDLEFAHFRVVRAHGREEFTTFAFDTDHGREWNDYRPAQIKLWQEIMMHIAGYFAQDSESP